MEEFPIKVELINPAMNEFIKKVQGFDPSSVKSKTEVQDIFDLVKELKSNFIAAYTLEDNEYHRLYDVQIEAVFAEFHENITHSINQNDYHSIKLYCKFLALSLIEKLGGRNACILTINLFFNCCIKSADALSCGIEPSDYRRDLLHYQMLLKSFLCSIKALRKYWSLITEQEQKCLILLCLEQAFKTFKMLGNAVKYRLRHVMIFLSDRLKQCTHKISNILTSSENEVHNSQFIVLMDSCLNMIDGLTFGESFQENTNKSIYTLSSLKSVLDELLCHAMTVNHISARDSDNNLIKSYSQKVIDEFNNVKKYTNETDFTLSVYSLRDTLYSLEEAVNTAVLNVVLNVFTDPNKSLKMLMDKCMSDTERENKSSTDLEHEILNFDEFMDKIMQIGLFAISCSTDAKKILEIRSCLASLESFEPELITSVISLYLSPNQEAKLTFRLIIKNWLEEMDKLKNLMDLVLDPAAFCRVVGNRLGHLAYELKENSMSHSDIVLSVNKILSYTKKLIKTLTRSIQDEEDQIKKKMKELVESLQLAYQECKASHMILNQDASSKEVLNRILKRTGLIMTSINNIVQNLSDVTEASEIEDYFNGATLTTSQNEFSIASLGQRCGNMEQLNVYNLNVISQELSNSVNTDILTPYINKGILRTKERTILYNTPKHTQQYENTPLRIPAENKWLRKVRPRNSFCKTLSCNADSGNSLDLELTAVLDNLTHLNETFDDIYNKASSSREKEHESIEDLQIQTISAYDSKGDFDVENIEALDPQKSPQLWNAFSACIPFANHKQNGEIGIPEWLV